MTRAAYVARDGHVGGSREFCRQCGRACVFYNRDGSLTRYALLCGYVEERGRVHVEGEGSSRRATLGMEHGVYHVTGFVAGRYVQQVFDSLSEARACFRTFPRR